MPFTLSQIHHTGLIVRDFEAMVAFYSDLFGKAPDTREEGVEGDRIGDMLKLDGPRLRVAFFELADKVAVELIEVAEPTVEIDHHRQDNAVMHLCFRVDSLQDAYDALREQGHTFEAEPITFTGKNGSLEGVSWAYFRDPEGNLLEIMEDA